MKQKISVKSYTFRFVIEPDRFPDGRRAYYAHIPELESAGAATWGYTKEETIRNLQEVTRLVVEELLLTKRSALAKYGRVSPRPLVTVAT